jgi:phospholipase/carboxylesterase
LIKTEIFESYFIVSRVPSQKLMIVLHGKGDSFRPFTEFSDELGIAEMNYLLLNAPKRFMKGYSWYGEPPYQRYGVLRTREKMFQLLAELEHQGWESKNIFLMGFSQGCLVSADVALHYPKPFGGVVGVSGYFHFEPRWRNHITRSATRTPWLLTHGRRDDVLPIEDTRFGRDKLMNLGLKIDWFETDKKHIFDENDYEVIHGWVEERLKSSIKFKARSKIHP